MRRAWVGLLLLVFVAGCGGDGDSGGDSVPTQEIPDALASFAESFVNNDAEALESFWSETCDPQDITDAEGASVVVDKTIPGEYHVSVGPDLVVEVDGDHVKVPLDQPEGAISATVIVNGKEVPALGEPLPFNVPVEFVFEDGAWKVQNCGGLFTEEE